MIIKIYDAVIGIMSKYATRSTGLSQPPESTVFTIYLIIIKVTGTMSEKYASMYSRLVKSESLCS